MYKIYWLDRDGNKRLSFVGAVSPFDARTVFEMLGFGTRHDIVRVERVDSTRRV